MSIKELLYGGARSGGMASFARNQTFSEAENSAITAESIGRIMENIKIPEPKPDLELVGPERYEKRLRGECDYCKNPAIRANLCNHHIEQIKEALKELGYL